MLIEKGKGKRGTDEVPIIPPDGGWGWMVVFGSFMIHVIADGMAYSFGIYVETFVHEFEATRSEVGFLGSMMLGVTWMSGPLAGSLTNKYGCRLVAIVGTIIAAIGFGISIFAPNIFFMYFSFGLVAGLGLGLAYLPAIVAVSFYFEKRRSLATGLAVCGSGFGTFIFAPLTQILLDEYGWKGTVLIEIGLLLNCIPCGALFRPVEAPRHKSVPLANQAERGDATLELTEKTNGFDAELRSTGKDKDTAESVVEATDRRRLSSSASDKTSSAAAAIGPMDRKDVFYNRSLQNIPMYASDPDSYRRSVISIDRRSKDEKDGGGCALSRCLGKRDSDAEGGSSKKMMDFSILTDPCFLLFAISNLLTSVGYVVAYIFLPDRGVQAGLSKKDAASLISIIGITNTVGRIVFGFMADYKWVNRLILYNTALVLCGLVSLFSALCYNYPLMAAYAAIFGLFIGVYICLTPIVIVDLLGLEKLSNAFGIVLLFQGIGTVVGPPLAGAVYDITQDYNNSFYLMGACITVSGAMLYVIPYIQRCQRRTLDDRNLATLAALETSDPPIASAVLPSVEEKMPMRN